MKTKQLGRAAGRVFCFALVLPVFVFSLPVLLAGQSEQPKPLKQDEACLACHGQADMKSEKGRDISIHPAKHAASAHGILGCKDCHSGVKDFPHPAKISKVQCQTCHRDQWSDVSASIHVVLGDTACSSCHGNVHELTAATQIPATKCADSHANEQKAFENSIHGQAAKAGDRDAPTCTACHGAVHEIRAATDAKSAVTKKNQAAARARCHADPGFLSRHKIPVMHPVEQYLQSVHRRAVMQGKDGAACADCHGSHEILPARDEHSKVSRWNVAATCGACHKEIAKTFLESVHGQAIKAGLQDAPDWMACHGEHLILSPANPNSPVNASHVSTETCGRCHGDVRLAQRLWSRYRQAREYRTELADSIAQALQAGKNTGRTCASIPRHIRHRIAARWRPHRKSFCFARPSECANY